MTKHRSEIYNRIQPIVLCVLLFFSVGWLSAKQPLQAQDQIQTNELRTGKSGLPIPRFVSLKADKVNLRKGPGQDHRIIWVYRHAGLPVEIIGETDHWRRVRDAEGNDGWIYFSLLSGRRTALIVPWSNLSAGNSEAPDQNTPLRIGQNKSSKVIALLEAGVVANINNCDGSWCNVSVDKFEGWIEQEKLWGVYRSESIN